MMFKKLFMQYSFHANRALVKLTLNFCSRIHPIDYRHEL